MHSARGQRGRPACRPRSGRARAGSGAASSSAQSVSWPRASGRGRGCGAGREWARSAEGCGIGEGWGGERGRREPDGRGGGGGGGRGGGPPADGGGDPGGERERWSFGCRKTGKGVVQGWGRHCAGGGVVSASGAWRRSPCHAARPGPARPGPCGRGLHSTPGAAVNVFSFMGRSQFLH